MKFLFWDRYLWTRQIREGGDSGIPIVASELPGREAYLDFAANAVRSISMRNANIRESEMQLS